MKIYRVAKKKFIEDLSGEGARLYGGRWNKKGEAMLYFSEHLSLCVLEMLTRIDFEFLTQHFAFIEVEISEKQINARSNSRSLPKNWRADPPLLGTQDFGSDWLRNSNELGISVPSAVLPEERNILINPDHKLATRLIITRKGALDLDIRLNK